MRILDPGHRFLLTEFDTSLGHRGFQEIHFMKREGPGYPGNIGTYCGTNMQEVMRVLISRTQYLNGQIPHWVNRVIVGCLRICINGLEYRAARRHGRRYRWVWKIEDLPISGQDGHVRF